MFCLARMELSIATPIATPMAIPTPRLSIAIPIADPTPIAMARPAPIGVLFVFILSKFVIICRQGSF